MKLACLPFVAAGFTPGKEYRLAEAQDASFGAPVCPILTEVDFWSPGHRVDSCSDGRNLRSTCFIRCVEPYRSMSIKNPHAPWDIECRGEWPNTNWRAVWKQRESNGCFFCPTGTLLPSATSLFQYWSDPTSGLIVGREARIRPDTDLLSPWCTDFVLALKLKSGFIPEDATFEVLGARVTHISSDRTVLTIKPNNGLNHWVHPYWNKNNHFGTRLVIHGSDLSTFGGKNVFLTYAHCNAFDSNFQASPGISVDDWSCMSNPIETYGTALQDDSCPTTPTTTTTTTTTTATNGPTTTHSSTTHSSTTHSSTTHSSTTHSSTTHSSTTHSSTTLPPSPTTTTSGGGGNGGCSIKGSHSLGANPNWWQSGNLWSYQAYVTIPISGCLANNWSATITFTKPISSLQFWSGTVQKIDSQGFVWKFTGNDQTYCNNIEFTYIGDGVPTSGGNTAASVAGTENINFCYFGDSTTQAPTTTLSTTTNGGGGGGTTAGPGTTTTTSSSTHVTSGNCMNGVPPEWQAQRCSMQQGYCPINPSQATPNYKNGANDYEKLLHLSIMFYEAQRSGPLSSTANRIPWRGSAGLKDGCDVGHDLTGGWYDAGDHVKFNFPMAYSVTTLAWGMISFRDGYVAAGEWNRAVSSIKWVTDYLIRCHTAPNEFWAQVGDGHLDHSFWGPAHLITHNRPSYKVDSASPGSDVAGEAAAALAAASIVFSTHGMTAYAAECLTHAKQLFNFANSFRGTYTGSVPASSFYNSWSGYNDEIAWAAAWIAKATGAASDISTAESLYSSMGMSSGGDYSWDDKKTGVQILMYEVTQKSSYKSTVSSNTNSLISNGPYTPQGMIYRQQWGPARHAANAAFIAIQAARNGIDTQSFLNFAKGQVDYLKGGNGNNQCFIVGFASNCPKRPHHRSSSCPTSGGCDSNAPGANLWTLYGALVGGPNQNDQWNDDRNDYIANEVATDYNAAWQGVLAGLVQML